MNNRWFGSLSPGESPVVAGEGSLAARKAHRVTLQRSSTKAITVAAAVVTALTLTACGERPQDISYKQGVYQGKPDTRAWDNPPFKGDQKAWELALKDRAQTQNEYKRTN